MNRDLYIKAVASSNSSEWQRPTDWLPMPTNITATDQIIASNAVSDKDVSNIVQYVAASAQEQANVTVTEFEKGLKGAEAGMVS